MAVNITPLHDRVLVRRTEEKESVKGGIIIPTRRKRSRRRAKWSPSAMAGGKKAN
jgi:chaperonin GroES